MCSSDVTINSAHEKSAGGSGEVGACSNARTTSAVREVQLQDVGMLHQMPPEIAICQNTCSYLPGIAIAHTFTFFFGVTKGYELVPSVHIARVHRLLLLLLMAR
jgi:cation transporter-like permease